MTLEIRPFNEDDNISIKIRRRSQYLPFAAQIMKQFEKSEKIIVDIPENYKEAALSTGVRLVLLKHYNQPVFISIGTDERTEKRVLVVTKRPIADDKN